MTAGTAGPSDARWESRDRPGSSRNREVVSAVGRVGGDVGEEAGGVGCDILPALWPVRYKHLSVTQSSLR